MATSLFPSPRPGDTIRSLWEHIPIDKQKKTVSLDELKTLFPETTNLGQVEVLERVRYPYIIYGQENREGRGHHLPIMLAYKCSKCEKIITGPPKIVDEDSIGKNALAGRKGYNVYCTNCNHELDEVIFEVS